MKVENVVQTRERKHKNNSSSIKSGEKKEYKTNFDELFCKAMEILQKR